MKKRKIIIPILSTFIICANLQAQYDTGTLIYDQTSTHLTLTSIQKNYIIEDFDGDFNTDIILIKSDATNNTSHLTWYKGDGTGNFSSQNNLLNVNDDHKENEIFYEDMNGDGIDDIIFQNNDAGFKVLLNDGFGNISGQINNTATIGNLVGSDLKEVADVDGDGDMDGIFFAKTDSMYTDINLGHCFIGYNNGTGTFSNYIYLDNDDYSLFNQVETGDIDGDGDLDIICGGDRFLFSSQYSIGNFIHFYPFIRVYKNEGLNNYAPKEEIDLMLQSNNSRKHFINVKMQDLNKDGSDELLAEYYFTDNCIDDLHLLSCENFHQFQVFNYSASSDEFVTLEHYNGWLHGYTPSSYVYYDNDKIHYNVFHIQFGHQNADNDLDILSVNVPQGRLQWYFGDGNGNFNSTQTVNFNSQYSSTYPVLRVADIDNDTDLDFFVLINDYTSSTLSAFKNLTLSPVCTSVLDLDNTPLSDGIYQAGTTLISSGDVASGNNNAVLKAGNNVKLQSGFKAPSNSTVKVRISNCN